MIDIKKINFQYFDNETEIDFFYLNNFIYNIMI